MTGMAIPGTQRACAADARCREHVENVLQRRAEKHTHTHTLSPSLSPSLPLPLSVTLSLTRTFASEAADAGISRAESSTVPRPPPPSPPPPPPPLLALVTAVRILLRWGAWPAGIRAAGSALCSGSAPMLDPAGVNPGEASPRAPATGAGALCVAAGGIGTEMRAPAWGEEGARWLLAPAQIPFEICGTLQGPGCGRDV